MKTNAMNSSAHELILDLEPAVSTSDGRLYGASVVARAAEDGHWNAWLEFVAHGSVASGRSVWLKVSLRPPSGLRGDRHDGHGFRVDLRG